jgi:catechol 2,3-dioxygenase-like lactoylglutathione lyase family enzyme
MAKVKAKVKSAKKPITKREKRPSAKSAKIAKSSSTKSINARSGNAKRPTAQISIPSPASTGDKLTFNHAMIYVKEVPRALAFYRELLGFKLIEEFKHDGISLYARLHAPGGEGTIALHLAGPGTPMASDGVRLYFEVRDLDGFCQKLQKKGFYITQMPRVMPWGWRHAYLNDPDGHEISLYWAGEMRMQKTVIQAAKTVERTPAAKAR